MKRFLKAMAVCAVQAVALLSCQDGIGPDKQSAGVDIQSVIVVGIDNTRTSVDAAGKVVWTEGDSISLSSDGVTVIYTIDPADAGKATARFTTTSGITFKKGSEVVAY